MKTICKTPMLICNGRVFLSGMLALFAVGMPITANALDFVRWSDYVIPEDVQQIVFDQRTIPDFGCVTAVRSIEHDPEPGVSERITTTSFTTEDEVCFESRDEYGFVDGRKFWLRSSQTNTILPDSAVVNVRIFEPPLVVGLPDRFLQGQVIGDATTVDTETWLDGQLIQSLFDLAYIREVAVLGELESVTVPYGTFTDCLKRRDITQNQLSGQWVEDTSVRWYCNGYGLVKQISITSVGKETVRELREIHFNP